MDGYPLVTLMLRWGGRPLYSFLFYFIFYEKYVCDMAYVGLRGQSKAKKSELFALRTPVRLLQYLRQA